MKYSKFLEYSYTKIVRIDEKALNSLKNTWIVPTPRLLQGVLQLSKIKTPKVGYIILKQNLIKISPNVNW